VTVIEAGKAVQRRVPAKASTINRNLRTLRAALKKVRPEYRFPAGAFFREDETRVRWLRPEEEEVLVLDAMASPFREIAQLAALTLMRMTEIRRLPARGCPPRAGRDSAPAGQGWRAPRGSQRGRAEGAPRQAGGSRRRVGVPWAAREALQSGEDRKGLQAGRQGCRAARFSFPRPETSRRHHGTQPGLHGADRDGARRLEERGDDAALCGVTDATLRAAAEAVSGSELGASIIRTGAQVAARRT
jgi:hypothetical protein